MFGPNVIIIASATVLTADDMREREIRERRNNPDDVVFLLQRLDEVRARSDEGTDG